MSNFEQAKKWLREGKRICRPDWKPRTFWILGIDETIECNHNNTEILKIPHIHLNQLEADDWKIYEELSIEQLNQKVKELEETCKILSNPEVIESIRLSLKQIAEGKGISLSKLNMKGGMKKHGRRNSKSESC